MAITQGNGALDYLPSGGAAPANPGSVARGGFPQVAPAESQVVQNSLAFLGAPGYVKPPTPKGPYATGYIEREARKVEQYRGITGQALSQGMDPAGYVFTGYSSSAGKSFKTIDQMMSDFESQSITVKKKLAKVLALAGYMSQAPEEATLNDVSDAYYTVLKEASQRFASGQNMTLDELLEMNVRYNLSESGVGSGEFSLDNAGKWYDSLVGEAEKAGPTTITRTDRSVDLFSPTDARGLARQTMQSILGRDPSEEEFEDFVAALNTAARNNPTITKTTTRYDAEGNMIGTNSRSRGGLTSAGVQEVLQEQAEGAPDWAEWQAVGTYFPEVMSALGSVVPGV